MVQWKLEQIVRKRTCTDDTQAQNYSQSLSLSAASPPLLSSSLWFSAAWRPSAAAAAPCAWTPCLCAVRGTNHISIRLDNLWCALLWATVIMTNKLFIYSSVILSSLAMFYTNWHHTFHYEYTLYDYMWEIKQINLNLKPQITLKSLRFISNSDYVSSSCRCFTVEAFHVV